ncbi:MAG TPA: hypothetical protein VFK06_02590 [Candidatus Angelobacter sp.]|nr:hypothetical protein [Candidatus Angelobacter sp.]
MPNPGTPLSDKDRARQLVRTVVLTQGNIFIRELLRRKRIPIGITKQNFEANLLEAISVGDLQLVDLIEWLDEVEGWGDQHVYLYHIPSAMTKDPLWNSANTVRQRLPGGAQEIMGRRLTCFS